MPKSSQGVEPDESVESELKRLKRLNERLVDERRAAELARDEYVDLYELGPMPALTICDALLFGGDDDLRAAVEEAHALGVRVQLLGIAPARQNQPGALVQSADSVRELGEAEVRSFLTLAQTGDGSS